MQTPDERRKAKAKRKRAAREAAYKKRVADAKARNKRIEQITDEFYFSLDERKARVQSFLNGTPAPRPVLPRELQRWTWDSRVKPPEGQR